MVPILQNIYIYLYTICELQTFTFLLAINHWIEVFFIILQVQSLKFLFKMYTTFQYQPFLLSKYSY